MTTEPRLADRFEALDNDIGLWAKLTKQKMFAILLEYGVQDKIKLAKSITRIKIARGKNGNLNTIKEEFLTKSLRDRIRKKNGDIESVAFLFARHGLFLHHGVGRSRPKGSGAANNASKPWLDILEPSVEDLANLLAEQYADIAAEEVKINIPGVLTTNIKVG